MTFNEPRSRILPGPAEDNINISEVWHLFGQKRRTIALITGTSVLIGVGIVAFSHPQFGQNGSLYTMGLKQSASPDATAANSTGSTYLSYLQSFQSVSDTETQVDMLTSQMLVQQAVLATGLNATASTSSDSFPRFWSWKILDGGRVSAYAPGPDDLQALYANFDDQSIIKKSYVVQFFNKGHYSITDHGALVLNGTLGSPASGGGLQLILQAANAGFTPKTDAVYKLTVQNPTVTVQTLLDGHLSVSPGGTATLPSDIINISFAWPNPYQGTQFVNQLMNNYINTIVSWNSTAASGMVDFITNQLKDVQTRLQTANQDLANYQQQTGILSPPDNAKNLIDEDSQYETQQAQLEVKVAALQRIERGLRTPNAAINPYLLSEASSTALSDLSEKLANVEAQLQSTLVQFTQNAPDVQSAEAQARELRYAIRSMVENQLAEAQSNLDTTNAQIAHLQSRMQAMPAQSLRVTTLTRSSDVLGQLYVLLMQKQQEATLSKAAEVSATRILTPAQIPFQSSAPKPFIIVAFAFVIGLILSAGWIVGRRAMSGCFETESEVRRLVRFSVYGLIPKMARADRNVLLAGNTYSAFSEAFRIARSNLYHAMPGSQSKVLLITSASVGDGKSIISANLAKSLADDGKRVLLIDGDLRRGHLHNDLGVRLSPGLSDWLITAKPVAPQTPAGERFAVLPCGVKPRNPAELMNDARLTLILKELRAVYDYIIFDSAPLPAVADSLVLARHADLTLSVIRLGQSTHKNSILHEHALALLANRHGLIINSVTEESTGYNRIYEQASRTQAERRDLVERQRVSTMT